MTATSADFRENPIPDFDVDRPSGSLAEWFVAEYEPLLRFAYFVTGNADSAHDVVQDAFVKLWRSRSRIRRDGFPAYARQTVANLARSGFRRTARDARRPRIVERPGVVHQPDIETRDEVWTAILSLSPQQRAVVALRFYEHMTEQQIAATLDVSIGTVKKQLSRAMERCRTQLGGMR